MLCENAHIIFDMYQLSEDFLRKKSDLRRTKEDKGGHFY
jgi:hypothetical protein